MMSRSGMDRVTRTLAALVCACMLTAACGAASPEPEAAIEPEATAAPEVTDAPEATAEPEVTAEPETTAEPEATIEPETTAEPEVTAEPAPVPTILDLLEIDWGAPNFVYAERWVPKEHVYAGGWTAEDDRVASITNRSGSGLTVEIVFISRLSGVSGTILRDVPLADGTLAAQPLEDGVFTLAPGETATVRLALAGAPVPDEMGGSIGFVKLNVVCAVD